MHMLQAKLAALAEVFVGGGPWDPKPIDTEGFPSTACRHCGVRWRSDQDEPEHGGSCLWVQFREVLDNLGKDRLEAKLVELDDLPELRDLALYMRKFADSIEVQISPNAEAESLRGWAQILSDQGDDEEARTLRDAAAIVEGL